MTSPGINSQTQTHSNHIQTTTTRVNGAEELHMAVFANTIYQVIHEEAQAHEAHFDSGNFSKVIDAINTDRIQAYILVVKSEDGIPHIAGGAIQYPTVHTKWNGSGFDHFPAVYSEDMYVNPDASYFFREKTKCESNPKGMGLGTFFFKSRIEQSVTGTSEDKPYGVASNCRIAEHAEGNRPIIEIYRKLHSTQETIPDGYVLEFKKIVKTESSYNKKVSVTVESLGSMKSDRSAVIHPNVFVVNWSCKVDNQCLAASFTQGISTFTGDSVVRVQLTSNNNLPHPEKLQAVLRGLFAAASQEILERGWINTDDSDSIPSFFKIHALGEKEILKSLRLMGATTRYLGPRPTRPVATEYRNIPKESFESPLPEAKPFATYLCKKHRTPSRPNKTSDNAEQKAVLPIMAAAPA